MALLVQKFGGTSLATLKQINHAADLVVRTKQAGHSVVVIVSAMGGETDKLIGFANGISANPDEREYAALVSTGEQVTMALMAMALIERGLKARSYTGAQARIQTCSLFKTARIQAIDTEPILQDINQGTVVVIAGFQGIDKYGNITTLGRGGSDTTAVAIAAALHADECQIYTDVDGVYTTDPRIVPNAKRLEKITFEEMLELSSLGAKVLQIRAVEFAGKYNIPLRVLSPSQDGPGTLITYLSKNNLESSSVTGIAFSRNEAKITLSGVPDTLGIAAVILAEISNIGLSIDLISQHLSSPNITNFTFTVHGEEYPSVLNKLHKIATKLQAQDVTGVTGLAKLSLVGAGLKSNPEIASIMLTALATKGINIQFIATSEIKISVLIDAMLLDEGVRALHTVFRLEESYNDESRAFSRNMEVEPLKIVINNSEK